METFLNPLNLKKSGQNANLLKRLEIKALAAHAGHLDVFKPSVTESALQVAKPFKPEFLLKIY